VNNIRKPNKMRMLHKISDGSLDYICELLELCGAKVARSTISNRSMSKTKDIFLNDKQYRNLINSLRTSKSELIEQFRENILAHYEFSAQLVADITGSETDLLNLKQRVEVAEGVLSKVEEDSWLDEEEDDLNIANQTEAEINNSFNDSFDDDIFNEEGIKEDVKQNASINELNVDDFNEEEFEDDDFDEEEFQDDDFNEEELNQNSLVTDELEDIEDDEHGTDSMDNVNFNDDEDDGGNMVHNEKENLDDDLDLSFDDDFDIDINSLTESSDEHKHSQSSSPLDTLNKVNDVSHLKTTINMGDKFENGSNSFDEFDSDNAEI